VPAEAEIGDFDVAARIKEDIVEFDVAVRNAAIVEEVEGVDELEKEALDFRKFEFALGGHVCGQFALGTIFHHNKQVLIRVQDFTNFDDMVVIDGLEDIDFLDKSLESGIVLHV
jgi:hypothetical protein